MVNNENNALKKVNDAFKNQKLHCQLVNSRGRVLATTNKNIAANRHNNLNLQTNEKGANPANANPANSANVANATPANSANVANVMNGGKIYKVRKVRKGGDMGLTTLIMPAGVNPFLTTFGLAALSGTSKGKRLVSDVNPVGRRKRSTRKRSVSALFINAPVKKRKRSVSKSKGRKRSVSKTVKRKVSRSRPRKSSASKSRTRKVRKGGNMMSLLFPRGLSASLTAAGLAGLAKTGHLGRSSLSKSRKTSRKRSGSRTVKKRKVVRRKVQSGGKVKRKTSRGGACWASEKNSTSKYSSGGNCPWASVGGAKKALKKHRGGGSDWIGTQYALGSSIAGDMTPCGPAVCMQKAFTSQPIVPNSQLANWIAPQSTGTVGSMCGGMSKLKKKKAKTARKSLKKKTKTARKSLKKKTKTARKSLKKKTKTSRKSLKKKTKTARKSLKKKTKTAKRKTTRK
jgi:hypothetical protein